MLRHSKLLLFVCVAVCCAGFLLLKGEPEQLPSGKWLPVGAMTSERAGACAALLPDGRVLITGGMGPAGALTTAEFFGADGSFTPAAEMGSPRSSHACTTLGDGRILITGGVNNGGALNTAEVYDPATDKWQPAGDLLVARSGHTATLLQDGRVLLAGGDSAGVALATLEIFNPAASSFDLAARSLSSPREKHAAVRLKDGRVLIAGGTDGTNTLASADVFDPITGVVAPAGKMTVPRMLLSATLQLDGRVFLAGGNDGKNDLASSEIYDPARGSFTASAPLTAPRSGHRAFRIPNNNSILLAGGTSEGVALQASDLFIPWTGSLRPTGALSNGRLLAAGSVLRRPGAVLLSGGARAASAEVYMTATVMTDKADYQPGDTVLITGSGWTPGETVTLNIVESPDDGDGPHVLTPTADPAGNISAQFPIEANDIGIAFTLTATGGTSGLTAQTTFTDTTHLKAIKVLGAQTPNPVVAGNSATYGTTASNSIEVDFNGNGSCPVTLSATGLPTGATAAFAPGSLTGTGTSSLFSLLTINTTTALSGGTYSFTVRADATGGDCPSESATASASLVVSTATTTSVVSSLNPSTYGTGVSFTATVTRTAGTGTPTGSVQFKIDGSPFGSPVPLGAPTTPTSATAVSGSTSTLKAGSHTITAEYTPSGSFGPSTGTVTQTVNPKALTITATTNTKTYDGTTNAAAVPTVSGLVGSDTVTGLAETYDNKNAGTGKTLTVSPGYTVNDGNSGNNYTVTTVTNTTGVINKAALTITAATNTKTYDGTTSAAAVPTTLGLVGGDTVTGLAETYDTKHVGTGKTLSVSAYTVNDGNSGNNYTVTTVADTTGVITKAPLTITAVTNTKTYDGTTSAAATPTVSGLQTGDTVTGLAETYDNKNAGTGKTLTVSAYTVNDGNSGNNYTVTTVTNTTGVINQRSLTVSATGVNKVYDGNTNATVTLSDNRVAGDSISTSYANAAFADKNVGVGKTVTVSGVSIAGTDAGNYTCNTTTTTTANISARPLTITAAGVNKVYDGTTTATVTLSDNRVAGDVFTDNYASAAFNNKNAGTGKTVNVSGISISGADAGNYTFNTTTTTTADITQRPLMVTATGVDKVYDGTVTASVTFSDNRIAGDVLTVSDTAVFVNKNVGNGKTISVTGISISGADAGNYLLSNTTATTTAN
ncbi:MAG TPA: YDG domain-containing protein, partial [Bryobacterales bacterium]|nr:YDG domain-containing protein [Bryobacterales bacterium]